MKQTGPDGHRRLTLKDVARAASVSHSTASRALRNVGRVSHETRMAVLAAADRLGYSPNLMARALKNGKTGTLSALVPRIDGPPVSDMIAILNDEMERAGRTLHLYCSFEDAERQLEKLHLIRGNSDGVFAVPTGDLLIRGREDLTRETLRLIESMNAPVVFVDRYLEVPGAGVVCSDNERGAYEAVTYLVSLGHRAIGYLTGPPLSSVVERLRGYRRALEQARIPFSEHLVERLVADSFEAGVEAAMRLLCRAPEITAVVTFNYNATVGVFAAVGRLGKQIPKDLSLVAFDDVPEVSSILVPITYVEQDVVNIGRHAAQLMLDMLQGGPAREIRVPPRLVVRQSVMPVRG
ncbi:MAG: LacI family DNA-binding transcriptional regulator [Bacillota bacterium]